MPTFILANGACILICLVVCMWFLIRCRCRWRWRWSLPLRMGEFSWKFDGNFATVWLEWVTGESGDTRVLSCGNLVLCVASFVGGNVGEEGGLGIVRWGVLWFGYGESGFLMIFFEFVLRYSVCIGIFNLTIWKSKLGLAVMDDVLLM